MDIIWLMFCFELIWYHKNNNNWFGWWSIIGTNPILGMSGNHYTFENRIEPARIEADNEECIFIYDTELIVELVP